LTGWPYEAIITKDAPLVLAASLVQLAAYFIPILVSCGFYVLLAWKQSRLGKNKGHVTTRGKL
jgi:hypothetical protein